MYFVCHAIPSIIQAIPYAIYVNLEASKYTLNPQRTKGLVFALNIKASPRENRGGIMYTILSKILSFVGLFSVQQKQTRQTQTRRFQLLVQDSS
jgi:hypothetical protein